MSYVSRHTVHEHDFILKMKLKSKYLPALSQLYKNIQKQSDKKVFLINFIKKTTKDDILLIFSLSNLIIPHSNGS